jgi:hypothetical protein
MILTIPQFKVKQLTSSLILSHALVTHSSVTPVRPHRRYPYFDIVMGLMGSNDPESDAGGSELLAGSPFPDRSKMMIQTKRGNLVLQVGGWA